MPAPLETCPTEVISMIVGHLDWAAITNLRLSGRSISLKTDASAHTRARFTHKCVDLTEEGLQAFADVMQQGGARGLCYLVKNLTLCGAAVVSDDQQPRSKTSPLEQQASPSRENRISLLSRALTTLAKNSPTGLLTSLSLEVVIPQELRAQDPPSGRPKPYREVVWRPIWTAAVDTFYMVFRALDQSRLRMRDLTIFNSAGQERCSLPCDALSMFDWDRRLGLADSLSTVRSLSISLSNRVFRDGEENKVVRDASPPLPEEPDADDEDQARSRDQDFAGLHDNSNFRGLAGLMHSLAGQQLEVFEWHYFGLQGELHDPNLGRRRRMHARLLSALANLEKLPRVRRCVLRGVNAASADLLGFVQRTGAADLSLEHVRLVSGTFGPLFDYCASDETPIASLSLVDLIEPDTWGLCYFLGPDTARIARMGWSLRLEGDGIKQRISYSTALRGPIDTPDTRQWFADRYREYGTY